MAKKATIGALVVTLGANSAQLVSELNKTKKGAQDWSQTMQKTAKIGAASFLAVSAAATGAGIAVIATVEKHSAAIDQLAKTSDKLGLVPEALQLMRYQAELTGVSMGTLDMATQRMTRRVAEAAQGTGEAVKALQELRLDAKQLAQMSPDKQFYAIAEAMKAVENQGDRVRLAMKLFDSEGVSLVNTLVSDLEAAEQKFDRMGIAITRQQAAMVEAYNDAKTDLGMLAQGFGQKLTVYLSGPFTEILRYVEELVLGMGGLDGAAYSAANTIVRGMAWGIKAGANFYTAIIEIETGFLKAEKAAVDFMGVVGALATMATPSMWAKKFGIEFDDAITEKFTKAMAARSVELGAEINQAGDKVDRIKDDFTTNVDEFLQRFLDSIPEPGTGDVTATPEGEHARNGLNDLGTAAMTAGQYLEQMGNAAKMGSEGQKLFNDIMGIKEPQRKTDGPIEKNYNFNQAVRAADARIKDGDAVNAQAWLNQMKQSYEFALKDTRHNYDVVGMEQIIKRMESMATAQFGDLDKAAKKEMSSTEAMASFGLDGRTFTVLAESSLKLSEQVNKMLGLDTSGKSIAEVTAGGKTSTWSGTNAEDVTAEYERQRKAAEKANADKAPNLGSINITVTKEGEGSVSGPVEGDAQLLKSLTAMLGQARMQTA
jgi:hypothetical protein